MTTTITETVTATTAEDPRVALPTWFTARFEWDSRKHLFTPFPLYGDDYNSIPTLLAQLDWDVIWEPLNGHNTAYCTPPSFTETWDCVRGLGGRIERHSDACWRLFHAASLTVGPRDHRCFLSLPKDRDEERRWPTDADEVDGGAGRPYAGPSLPGRRGIPLGGITRAHQLGMGHY